MPRRLLVTFAVAGFLFLLTKSASALIMGGIGNDPIPDPGWSKGATLVFNDRSRIAWWEGPPFGGGEYHAECRGNAQVFNACLANFAKTEAKTKCLIVHDGVKHSTWLRTPKGTAQPVDNHFDWELVVWDVRRWKDHRAKDLGTTPDKIDLAEPIAVVHVYTANVPWKQVVVPSGIEVVDDRLEAHGFTANDGIVIGGQVTDIVTRKPVAAVIQLERVESKAEIRGLRGDSLLAETKTDSQGRWVLKHLPAEWCRVVVRSQGYAPRVTEYARFGTDPHWQSFDTSLAPSASLEGKVTDESGQPLADVRVSISEIKLIPENHYRNPADHVGTKSDAQGHFRIDDIPTGPVSLSAMKEGYAHLGSLHRIPAPQKDLEIKMGLSAILRVTVEFPLDNRPESYIVELEPEGGPKVGTYGGSANINISNQYEFKNVPPGKYIVKGHPNPSSPQQTTDLIHIDLKGSQFKEVILKAK